MLMNPTEQSVEKIQSQQAPAKLQTKLVYIKGTVAIGDHTGILEWGADDRIRLFEIDSSTDQLVGKVFDLALSDIKSIGGVGSSLAIIYGNERYSFVFSTLGVVVNDGSLIGAIAGAAVNKSAGVFEWLKTFKEHNVKITYWGNKKILKVTLIACAILFFVFVPILALIFSVLIPNR